MGKTAMQGARKALKFGCRSGNSPHCHALPLPASPPHICPAGNERMQTMFFRLIEREGVAGQHTFRVTQYPTLDIAREMANASASDFLIENDSGKPIEYRVA